MCGVWRRWEKKQWAIIGLFSEYFHFTSDLKANKINKKHPCVILLYVNEFGLSIMSQPDPFTEEFVKPI